MDISIVTPTTLDAYDVVVLGARPADGAQVVMLSGWVNAGGNAHRAASRQAARGPARAHRRGGTLSNAYLKVNTASGAGAGIVGETMQFHGAADRYTLNGATAVATLYSNADHRDLEPRGDDAYRRRQRRQAPSPSRSTSRARSSTRARAIRRGRARSATADRADPPRRPVLRNAKAGDPQPDWVDLNKVAIPQADEQQRLLANAHPLRAISHRKPLPRFWYLPKG